MKFDVEVNVFCVVDGIIRGCPFWGGGGGGRREGEEREGG